MIGNDWDEILQDEFEKPYFKEIVNKLKILRKETEIYPPANDVFNAFKYTKYQDVRVVIIGQDPYHGIKQANGLAFSVNENITPPPSLKNIFKELYNDIGVTAESGNLQSWSKQGVLLLNAVLTVEKGKPGSHQPIGWEAFTDAVIQKLNQESRPIIFVLWGNYAINKKKLITNHPTIESAHPSPFSSYRGFFGSKPFSKINNMLETPIDWAIKKQE